MMLRLQPQICDAHDDWSRIAAVRLEARSGSVTGFHVFRPRESQLTKRWTIAAKNVCRYKANTEQKQRRQLKVLEGQDQKEQIRKGHVRENSTHVYRPR